MRMLAAGIGGFLVVLCAVTASSGASAQGSAQAGLQDCLGAVLRSGSDGRSCIGSIARTCLKRPESDTTHGEIACYRGETEVWDRMLNTEYNALLAAAPSPQVGEKIREAQRLWLRGRDADCQVPMLLLDGTMAQPMVASCAMEATAVRALALRHWRLLVQPQ